MAPIRARTRWLAAGYRRIAKPLFFRQDPEVIHNRMTRFGAWLGRSRLGRGVTSAGFSYRNPRLERTVLGLRFPNPIGLGGGFDKNGRLLDILPAVGFGFIEIGSITAEPSAGNPKPRLWRVPAAEGLIVNYGLVSDGVTAVAERLRRARSPVPIGTNIAASNVLAVDSVPAAIDDYAASFTALAGIGQYFTINLSCPNRAHDEWFWDPAHLEALLGRLDAIPTEKPVLLKLSPDLNPAQRAALLAVADRHRVHGFVIANLTKHRTVLGADETLPPGGLSGPVLQERLLATLAELRARPGRRYVLIALGGINDVESARAALAAGADLLQLVTALVYRGPQVVGEIAQGLAG